MRLSRTFDSCIFHECHSHSVITIVGPRYWYQLLLGPCGFSPTRTIRWIKIWFACEYSHCCQSDCQIHDDRMARLRTSTWPIWRRLQAVRTVNNFPWNMRRRSKSLLSTSSGLFAWTIICTLYRNRN